MEARLRANSAPVAGAATVRDGGGAPYAQGGVWTAVWDEFTERDTQTAPSAAAQVAAQAAPRHKDLRPHGKDEAVVSSRLARDYAVGALPVRVVFKERNGRQEKRSSSERRVSWLVDDVLRLDLRHYVPLFVEAFTEKEGVVSFIAIEAVLDLVAAAGPAHRLLALPPLFVPALKRALRSKSAVAVERALRFLEAFVRSDQDNGGLKVAARTLPIKAVAASVGAAAAAHPALAADAQRTLMLLEAYGGPNALVAIKAGVRTYESTATATCGY